MEKIIRVSQIISEQFIQAIIEILQQIYRQYPQLTRIPLQCQQHKHDSSLKQSYHWFIIIERLQTKIEHFLFINHDPFPAAKISYLTPPGPFLHSLSYQQSLLQKIRKLSMILQPVFKQFSKCYQEISRLSNNKLYVVDMSLLKLGKIIFEQKRWKYYDNRGIERWKIYRKDKSKLYLGKIEFDVSSNFDRNHKISSSIEKSKLRCHSEETYPKNHQNKNPLSASRLKRVNSETSIHQQLNLLKANNVQKNFNSEENYQKNSYLKFSFEDKRRFGGSRKLRLFSNKTQTSQTNKNNYAFENLPKALQPEKTEIKEPKTDIKISEKLPRLYGKSQNLTEIVKKPNRNSLKLGEKRKKSKNFQLDREFQHQLAENCLKEKILEIDKATISKALEKYSQLSPEQKNSYVEEIQSIFAEKTLVSKQAKKKKRGKDFLSNKIVDFQKMIKYGQANFLQTHQMLPLTFSIISKANTEITMIQKSIKQYGLKFQKQDIQEISQSLYFQPSFLLLLDKLQNTLQDNQKMMIDYLINRKKQESEKKYQDKEKEHKIQAYKYQRKLYPSGVKQNCGSYLRSPEQCLIASLIRESQNIPQQQINQEKVQRRKIYQKQLQVCFMPYFHELSNRLRELIFLVGKECLSTNIRVIKLKKIDSLQKDCTIYVNQYFETIDRMLSMFQRVPIKAFKLADKQKKESKQFILTLQKNLSTIKPIWQTLIKQKYIQLQQILNYPQKNQKALEKCEKQPKSIIKKNQNNEPQVSLQLEIKHFEEGIDQIINKKTYIVYEMRCEGQCKGTSRIFILDTNQAKSEIIRELENKISLIYKRGMVKMRDIGMEWSREMARTERMLAYQIDYEKQLIQNKISNYYCQYNKYFSICFLNRKYLYSLLEQHENDRKNHLRHSTGTQKSLSFFTYASIQTFQELQADQPGQFHNTLFKKYLDFLYNMSKRTKEKMQQISEISKLQNERIKLFSKSLEKQEFAIKSDFIKLAGSLETVQKEIKSKGDFLKKQEALHEIYTKFQQYKHHKKLIEEEMLKHDMPIWQDDQNFENTLELSLKIINFLFSEAYRRINHQTIDILTPKTFLSFYTAYQKLKKSLLHHKFSQYFSQYNYSTDQKKVIEMCLYKSYTEEEKKEFLKFGINIITKESTMKICDIINTYKSNPSIFEEILKIFYKRKGEKFTKQAQKIIPVDLNLFQIEQHETQVIKNSAQIQESIKEKMEEKQWNSKLKQANQLQIEVLHRLLHFSETILNTKNIIKHLSEKYLKEIEKNDLPKILQKFQQKYHMFLKQAVLLKVLYLPSFSLEMNRVWLELDQLETKIQEFQMKSKMYYSFSEITPRSLFLSFTDLMKLIRWNNPTDIESNIKILFPQITSIEIKGSQLSAVLLPSGLHRSDLIQIPDKKPTVFSFKNDKPLNIIKNLEQKLTESIKRMVNNSNGRTGQIKILSLLLYFTQQIQTSMFMNLSLDYLSKNLHEKIKDISADLRYDINNHKQEEICQINTFVHYIKDHLGAYPALQGFQWQSTIRYYQKSFQILICKDQQTISFKHEPKSVRTLTQMNRKLLIQIGCGDNQFLMETEENAYILGSPYFKIFQIRNSYLTTQKNIFEALRTIKNSTYFVSVMAQSNETYSSLRRRVKGQLERDKQFDFLQQCVLLYSIKNSQAIEAMTFQNQPSTPKSSSSIQQTQVIQKVQRIPFFFCIEGIPDVPKYLCPLYRTSNTLPHPPFNIILYLHLLVQSATNISMKLKNSIIWKYTKLQDFLKSYKSLSNQVLLKTFQAINKYIKENCSEVINPENVATIGQIINNFCSIQYQQIFEDLKEIFLAHFSHTLQVKQERKVVYPRKQVLNRLIDMIDQRIKINNHQPIIIYGEKTTCKSTLIQKLLEKHPHLERIYSSPDLMTYFNYKSSVLENLSSSRIISQIQIKDNTQKIYECSLLEFLPHQVLHDCFLVYVPEFEKNEEFYEQIRAKYFLEEISHILTGQLNFIAAEYKNSLLQELGNSLWTEMNQFFSYYQKICRKNSTFTLMFEEILPMLLNIISKVFKRAQEKKDTYERSLSEGQQVDSESLANQIDQKVVSIKELFYLITIEYFTYSLEDESSRREFQDLITYHMEQPAQTKKTSTDLSKCTYTIDGQIISNSINKGKGGHFSRKISHEQTSFASKLLKLNGQRQVIRKYQFLQIPVMVWSNSHFSQKQLAEQLLAKEPMLNAEIVLHTKIQYLENVLLRVVDLHNEKQSKVMISRNALKSRVKLVSVESKKVIFENTVNREEKVFLFVEDVHLGNYREHSLLKKLTEQQESSIKEILTVFGSKEHGEKIGNRYKRNFSQIFLQDLKFQSIFQLRNRVLGEDKNNFGEVLFEIFSNFDQETKINFLFETSLTLPSLMFYKFLYIKFIKLFLNATSLLKEGRLNHPTQIIKEISSQPKIRQKFYKLLDKQVYLLQKSKDKFYEPDVTVSKEKSFKFLKNLSLPEQIICQKYQVFVPFALSRGIFLLRGDSFRVFPKMVKAISEKSVIYLTHQYMKQISQAIASLMYTYESNIILVIPSFLSAYAPLLQLLKMISQQTEIIFGVKNSQSYEATQLWSHLWQAIKRREYVQNLINQELKMKREIEDILKNKISYFIELDEAKYQQIYQPKTKNDPIREQTNIIEKFLQNEKNPMKSPVKNLTVIDLKLKTDEKIKYIEEIICEYFVKNSEKILHKIANVDDRNEQIRKLNQQAVTLIQIMTYLLTNRQSFLTQNYKYSEILFNERRIVETLTKIFKEITNFLLDEKSKFPVKQTESSNPIKPQSIKSLKQIQVLYEKIKQIKTIRSHCIIQKEKYVECQQHLRNKLKEIEQKLERQDTSESALVNYLNTEVIRKSSHISDSFTKLKNGYIQSFDRIRKPKNEIIRELVQKKEKTDEIQIIVHKINQKSTEISIKARKNILWIDSLREEQLIQNRKFIQELEQLQKIAEELSGVQNQTSFTNCISYIKQLAVIFETDIQEKLSRIIAKVMQKYRKFTEELKLSHIQQIMRKQINYAQYLQVIDSIEKVKDIIEAIQEKIKSTQFIEEGFIDLMTFKLEQSRYEFVKFIHGNGTGNSVTKQPVQISQIFESSQSEEFSNLRIIKKQCDELELTIYQILMTQFLSQLPFNLTPSKKILSLLKISNSSLKTHRLNNFSSHFSKDITIHELLFHQEKTFQKYLMHKKEKDEKIYERKDKGNFIKNKNIQTITGEMQKDNSLKSKNEYAGNIQTQILGKNYLALRSKKAQAQISSRKNGRTQKKNGNMEDLAKQSNIPLILYDEGGEVLDFLYKFQQNYKYQIYGLKHDGFQTYFRKSEYSLSLISQINPSLKQINHIPTFYLYFYPPYAEITERNIHLSHLQLISTYLKKKESNFYDHLVIFVQSISMLQELRLSVDPTRNFRTWCNIINESDIEDIVQEIVDNGEVMEFAYEGNRQYKISQIGEQFQIVSDSLNLKIGFLTQEISVETLNLSMIMQKQEMLLKKIAECQKLRKKYESMVKILEKNTLCITKSTHIFLDIHQLFKAFKKLAEEYRIPLNFIKSMTYSDLQILNHSQKNYLAYEETFQDLYRKFSQKNLKNNQQIKKEGFPQKQMLKELSPSKNFVRISFQSSITVIMYSGEIPKHFISGLLMFLNSQINETQLIWIKSNQCTSKIEGVTKYYPEMQSEQVGKKSHNKKIDILKRFYSSNFNRISSQTLKKQGLGSLNKENQKMKKYIFLVDKKEKECFVGIYHKTNFLQITFQSENIL